MVWAGNSRGGRTDPHIVLKGMMTGLCYRDDMLDVNVRPYASAIGPSSSSWTTTLDFIVPEWFRNTSSRRGHATGGDFATSSPTNDSRGT